MRVRVRGVSRSRRAGSLTSIAATAGVSVSTVSKVLNGRTDVAPETRERLGRILRLHGYQVAPRSGIGVVDLLIGGLGSLWSDELIRGAVTAAAETEISVIVSHVASAGEFARWLKIATARGTLGALSVLYLPDQAMLRRMADANCRWWSSTRRPSRAGRSGRSAPPTGRAACPSPGTSSSSAIAGSPPSAGRITCGPAAPGSTATAAPCAGPTCRSTRTWSAATS